MSDTSTRIVPGVPGPGGEAGVLLIAPRNEALDWDLRAEVASTSLYWMADRQAWWVAAPYASTAEAILGRTRSGAEGAPTRTASAAVGAVSPLPAWTARAQLLWARLRGRLTAALTGQGTGIV